ncbi:MULTISPECIES: hypothetical protein [unclassified Rhodococcus (in: high G+C Gram-positive bacteria)]|uniref:hypothetical protein n=1 Tax=unclassified Rhodococcus (in: high G+C Gram-positive bacteria) TaxID=192944 RepID=UPI0012E36E26|nr:MULTISPECIES: hypothetical protein [unclassified Rhodococcus (in: high G+C Gram-positive bacteria)]
MAIFAASITLFLGILTSVISWRNAKKTPHEQLKQIFELQELLGPTAELKRRKILEAALDFELGRIDRVTQSRRRGVGRTLKRVWNSHPVYTTMFIALSIFILAIAVRIASATITPAVGGSFSGREPLSVFSSIATALLFLYVCFKVLSRGYRALIDLPSD